MHIDRVEAGVDWISMSMPVGVNPSAEWYQECLGIIERIQDDGNEAKERNLLGYAGISVGNCFCGAGESTYYCQLTGSYAPRYWRDIYRLEGHISRLDIQCTVFFSSAIESLGVDTLAVARHAAIGKGSKPKWSVTRVDDNSGGFSMYVGSKDSEHYLNMYNKEVESKDERYKNSWRYELRLKNEYGTKAARALYVRPGAEHNSILETVRRWLLRRGISAPWEGIAVDSIIAPLEKPKTDKETALWWLSHQVKPALDKAAKLGYYKEACEALGLLERPFYNVSRETGEVTLWHEKSMEHQQS